MIFKQINPQSIRTSLLAGGVLLLTACIPTTVGVIAVSTIDLVKERRTVGTYIDDNLIEASILKEVLTDPTLGRSVHVSATVLNGIALLTGEVSNGQQKQRAGEIADSFQGVDQVINQLDLLGKSSLTSRTNDSLITAKVKTELIRDKAVDSTNIKVVTERGVVYLMGIATATEEEKAVELAKSVGGVVRIVKVMMRPAQ